MTTKKAKDNDLIIEVQFWKDWRLIEVEAENQEYIGMAEWYSAGQYRFIRVRKKSLERNKVFFLKRIHKEIKREIEDLLKKEKLIKQRL